MNAKRHLTLIYVYKIKAKTSISALAILFVLAFANFSIKAKEPQQTQEALNQHSFFISYDEHGNKVFSDYPPAHGKYKKSRTKTYNSLKWAPSKPIKSTKATTTRSKSKTKTKAKDSCDELSTRISRTENDLTLRQKPQVFNQLKTLLSNLRWQYRKKCT